MSQFTKKAIMESFSKLIEDKPLDRITVKDIVADCGVTRNTFYYHFEDLFALAKAVLLDRLSQIGSSVGQENDWEEFLLLLARHVSKNRRSFRNLFHSGKSKEVSRFVREILTYALEKLFDYIADGKKVSPELRRFTVDYYTAATLATVLEKLETGKEEAEIWIRRICQALYAGMKSCIDNADRFI